MIFALGILILVSYCDAEKKYSKLYVETLGTMGEVVQLTINSFLNSGQNLKEYGGYETIISMIDTSDIEIIEVIDIENKSLFKEDPDNKYEALHTTEFTREDLEIETQHYSIKCSRDFYLLEFKLSNKIDQVGSFHIYFSKNKIISKIHYYFNAILFIGLIILILSIFAIAFSRKLKKRVLFINLWYSIAFITMAICIYFKLLALFDEGIKNKTKMMAESLAKRINIACDYGIDLDRFKGIDFTFDDYMQINKDISFIEITKNSTDSAYIEDNYLHLYELRINTSTMETNLPIRKVSLKEDGNDDRSKETVNYGLNLEIIDNYIHIEPEISSIKHLEDTLLSTSRDKSFGKNYVENISIGNSDQYEENYRLHLGVPKKIIKEQSIKTCKNFIVLFIATSFLIFIIINLLILLEKSELIKEFSGKASKRLSDMQSQVKLNKVYVLFFLSVFIEGLFISFLPQFLKQLSGPNTNISIFYTLYFAAFVISLIPSGQLVDKWGVKRLFVVAILLFSTGYILMASFSYQYEIILTARFIAGLGHGMLFIGVQAYIQKNVDPKHKTKGAGIIVFGFNGGVISGTAIGSMLINYLAYKQIFLSTSIIGISLLLFVFSVITDNKIEKTAENEIKRDQNSTEKRRNLLKEIGSTLLHWEFLKTILFVGIAAKIVMAGVNSFALPSILHNYNYKQEEIGQLLMLYPMSVIVSTFFTTKIIDRLGETKIFIFIGAFMGGIGLIIMGLMDKIILIGFELPYFQFRTLLLIVGIVILGLSHGLIHAPIMTHISETAVAKKFGSSFVSSLYRLLERVGHISGPYFVGVLLIYNDNAIISLSIIGLIVVILSILFASLNFNSKNQHSMKV